MITQKTWTDLLGKPQGNESVDGNDIVREVDLNQFRILWSFETPKKAKECLDTWYDEADKIYYQYLENNS